MEKKVIDRLKLDIENAERFFERTGEGAKEAYKCMEPNIDKVNSYGIQNIFLYIPESDNDIYTMFFN